MTEGIEYVPLYAQLERILLRQIRDGTWKPGDRIPTEQELGQTYRVSRLTVRQALSRLTSDGLIERHRGRGSYVARPRIEHQFASIRSFEEQMAASGVAISYEVLEFARTTATDRVRVMLDLRDDYDVFRLQRKRFVGGDILGLEVQYFPSDLGSKVKAEDVASRPALVLVEELLGRPAKELFIEIACRLPAAEEARNLQIRGKHPVLVRHHCFGVDEARRVLCGYGVFPGDRYAFSFDLFEDRGQIKVRGGSYVDAPQGGDRR